MVNGMSLLMFNETILRDIVRNMAISSRELALSEQVIDSVYGGFVKAIETLMISYCGDRYSGVMDNRDQLDRREIDDVILSINSLKLPFHPDCLLLADPYVLLGHNHRVSDEQIFKPYVTDDIYAAIHNGETDDQQTYQQTMMIESVLEGLLHQVEMQIVNVINPVCNMEHGIFLYVTNYQGNLYIVILNL